MRGSLSRETRRGRQRVVWGCGSTVSAQINIGIVEWLVVSRHTRLACVRGLPPTACASDQLRMRSKQLFGVTSPRYGDVTSYRCYQPAACRSPRFLELSPSLGCQSFCGFSFATTSAYVDDAAFYTHKRRPNLDYTPSSQEFKPLHRNISGIPFLTISVGLLLSLPMMPSVLFFALFYILLLSRLILFAIIRLPDEWRACELQLNMQFFILLRHASICNAVLFIYFNYFND